MKTLSSMASVAAALALATLPAMAASYTDPGGAGDFTGGNLDLDITSVSVVNDASMLTFTINVAGNPMNNNWYDYYVGISRNLFGGVGGNLNGTGGWGKDIQMSVGGMDYFVGGYPYWGGYSLLTWDGSAWITTTGVASENSTSVTIPVALSALGLSGGDSFTFDVWTSSTGNTVFDALSDGTARSWNNNPFNTGPNALAYTVEIIPEPGIGALFGLGALLVAARRVKTAGLN